MGHGSLAGSARLRAPASRILAALLVLVGLAAAPGPATADDVYRINVGDQIEVDILDDREPPVQFLVGGDGDVQLPLIGGVTVAGLTVAEARQSVRDTYAEREIYRDPTVELSVVQYRQIFVLGDVKNPGAYDFVPFLSAEQALGLAGGPAMAANNEEARILERSRLYGSLNALDADLTRAAVKQARARAQLRGESTVAFEDVTKDLRPIIDRSEFELLKLEEERLIAVEERDFRTEHASAVEAVEKVAYEIELLREREGLEDAALQRAREQLELDEGLVSRGLSTRAATLRAERELDASSSDLLELREQISVAERRLSQLEVAVADLEASRELRLLSALQDHSREVARLSAERASLIDRLGMLGQWIDAAATGEAEVRIDYHIRRRSRGEAIRTVEVDAFTELLPGDLLVVTLRPAGLVGELSQ
jgi:exopolysaccharide production protein ExoF